MADAESWQHRRGTVNGVSLHYVEAGTGPLVVLLHGFPEFWYCWRHQLPALAAAGFRAVAPDLRGYGESDKPAGIDSYRPRLLMADVLGLIEHFGERNAVVIGHDWGGAIAWRLAAEHPEAVNRLIVLNAPHPAAFVRELRRPAQWYRSSYMPFFQLPFVPEWLLRLGNHALLVRALRRQPCRPDTFTPEDIARYRQSWSRPGALTASLNYYRAARRYRHEVFEGSQLVQVPTLLIWGECDRYLGVGLTEELDRWVPGIRVERLPNASHWVQNDAPEEVNRLIVEFLR